MPFAPRVRKQVLKALEEFILPALRTPGVLQVLAEPPFDFSQAEHWPVQRELLPDKEHAPLQMIRNWEQERLMTLSIPTFYFVYDGIGYEQVGMTKSLVARLASCQQAEQNGITQLRLPSPAFLCYPPYIPRSSGAPRAEPWPEAGRLLGIKLLEESILIFLNFRGTGEPSTHNLEINDATIAQMTKIYMAELRHGDKEGAQAQLLAMMCRLKRHVAEKTPGISNSCWVSPTVALPPSNIPVSSRNRELCRQLMEYVQTHLHMPLSLKLLAARLDVSAVHLNTIFKQTHGITVMRYVTQQRIIAAREIIAHNPERISDVAKLVGFANASSFCAVFHKHTGMTPNEYRHQERSLRK